MSERVSAIVATWNSGRTVAACLDSVLAQDWPRVELLVVDNGSSDRTRKIVQSRRGVVMIPLGRNAGFSRACNAGIARSSGEYVLLLNADAELAPDFLSRIVPELRSRPRAGSATGKVLRSRGCAARIDSAGIALNRLRFSPSDRGQGELDAGRYSAVEEVFGPSGAAAVYRRAALEDVRLGGEYLDEDFFAYYEDVDLAWRLQLRGWTSWCVPQAVAWHPRRGPQAQPQRIAGRAYFNRFFCYAKNETRANLKVYGLPSLLWESARTAWHVVNHPYILPALPRAAALLPAMMRKRRAIQAGIVVSAEQARHL